MEGALEQRFFTILPMSDTFKTPSGIVPIKKSNYGLLVPKKDEAPAEVAHLLAEIKAEDAQSTPTIPEVPYKPPKWSNISKIPFSIEVIKGGVLLESIPITSRPFTVIGRVPVCDIIINDNEVCGYNCTPFANLTDGLSVPRHHPIQSRRQCLPL